MQRMDKNGPFVKLNCSWSNLGFLTHDAWTCPSSAHWFGDKDKFDYNRVLFKAGQQLSTYWGVVSWYLLLFCDTSLRWSQLVASFSPAGPAGALLHGQKSRRLWHLWCLRRLWRLWRRRRLCCLGRHHGITEGSLEVKLPTRWTDGKAGLGRVREEKRREERRGEGEEKRRE